MNKIETNKNKTSFKINLNSFYLSFQLFFFPGSKSSAGAKTKKISTPRHCKRSQKKKKNEAYLSFCTLQDVWKINGRIINSGCISEALHISTTPKPNDRHLVCGQEIAITVINL